MTEQNYEWGEVDLREYLGVIVKRKKVILAVFLAAIITASIIIILSPKVYLVEALVQNGRPISISGADKREAKEIIDSYDFLAVAIKGLKIDTNIERFRDHISTEDLKGGKRLLIKVNYRDKDIAFEACKLIADSYVTQGNVLYQESVALTSDFLKEISEQAQFYRSNIERLRTEVLNLSSTPPRPAKASATSPILGLYSHLVEYTSNLNSLIAKRNDLLAVLSKRREFKIIMPPVRPSSPVQPDGKLYILVAAIVGLIGGLLVAFLLEYIKNNYRKTK